MFVIGLTISLNGAIGLTIGRVMLTGKEITIGFLKLFL